MLASHWARCAGGLLVWALAGVVIPAKAGAHSAPPLATADPDLAELRGLEHTPFRMDDPVGPDARCRNAGAADLYERGRRVPGWEIGQYNCDDRVVFTLEREVDSSRLRIVDTLIVPGATYSGNGSKSQVSWGATGDGVCGQANRQQSTVIVALRWNSRDRVSARSGILQAWRFNAQRGRIESTSTRGIVCINPKP